MTGLSDFTRAALARAWAMTSRSIAGRSTPVTLPLLTISRPATNSDLTCRAVARVSTTSSGSTTSSNQVVADLRIIEH